MRILVSFLLMTACLPAADTVPITGIAHVGFKVSDLEKARAFYTGVLGFHDAYDLKYATGVVAMAFFKVNENQCIELSPGLAASEDVRFTHVAFSTSDIEKLHTMLEARGVKVGPLQMGADGNRNFSAPDPENNFLEFVQYMPGSMLSEARGKYLQGRISTHMYHTGITVAKPDATLAFYRDKLDFVEFWRGGPAGEKTAWINMRTPGTRGDYIELMLYSGTPTREQYGSMHHICLEVPDIQEGRKTALARHYKDPKVQARLGRNRKWQLNLFDPDGTRVELMEPKAQP
jgi:catechol 2,3-dioxygenase-like lactoylglutathione lyase family enzyme